VIDPVLPLLDKVAFVGQSRVCYVEHALGAASSPHLVSISRRLSETGRERTGGITGPEWPRVGFLSCHGPPLGMSLPLCDKPLERGYQPHLTSAETPLGGSVPPIIGDCGRQLTLTLVDVDDYSL
jgi:hypothetical protein